jgi:hypothetical protein
MRIVIALLLALFATPCGALLVQWTGNGHWYEARHTPDRIDWEAAQAQCAADGGYLATILSAEENEFVFALASGDSSFWYIDAFENGIGPWIGGIQVPGSLEPDGGWHWITGEPWSYTNWASGEPNNFALDENRAHLFGLRTLIGDTWNDVNWDEPLLGYIFEVEELPTPVSPVTWGRVKGLFSR